MWNPLAQGGLCRGVVLLLNELPLGVSGIELLRMLRHAHSHVHLLHSQVFKSLIECSICVPVLNAVNGPLTSSAYLSIKLRKLSHPTKLVRTLKLLSNGLQ